MAWTWAEKELLLFSLYRETDCGGLLLKSKGGGEGNLHSRKNCKRGSLFVCVCGGGVDLTQIVVMQRVHSYHRWSFQLVCLRLLQEKKQTNNQTCMDSDSYKYGLAAPPGSLVLCSFVEGHEPAGLECQLVLVDWWPRASSPACKAKLSTSSWTFGQPAAQLLLPLPRCTVVTSGGSHYLDCQAQAPWGDSPATWIQSGSAPCTRKGCRPHCGKHHHHHNTE